MTKGLTIDTICLYTGDLAVMALIKKYTTQNNLACFIAEDESDLVAVPYSLLIIDINLLPTSDFIEWLATSKKQGVFWCEIIVSHTKPSKKAEFDVSDLFAVKEEITEQDITLWREMYRERKNLPYPQDQ